MEIEVAIKVCALCERDACDARSDCNEVIYLSSRLVHRVILHVLLFSLGRGIRVLRVTGANGVLYNFFDSVAVFIGVSGLQFRVTPITLPTLITLITLLPL